MKTICLIKDANHQVVIATTNWDIAAKILADAHNKALENGAIPNEDFADSLSGYHCSVWSENGKVLSVYGEEDTVLCNATPLTAEDIKDDMFDVVNFAE